MKRHQHQSMQATQWMKKIVVIQESKPGACDLLQGAIAAHADAPILLTEKHRKLPMLVFLT